MFLEFAWNAWEKRKLGEVVERVTRKNRDLVSTRPLTISAQDGLVDQRKFFSKTVASKNISNYFLLKAGDFAYNKSYSVGYPWGAVKRLDKYPSGVLSTLYIVFKPKKINSQFLVTYFEGTTWYVSVSKVASEGARNHGLLNISASDFFDQQLFFPTKKTEQESIGLTIKVLDDLIAATQDKIDALEQAKKALLQRLFDQSWRFKGYSDPWEKRKVSDYLCESRIPGSNGLKAKKLTVKLWGKGVVPKNETYSGSIKTKYYVRSANQLIYGKLDFLHAAFGIVPQSLDGWESTIDSPAFDVNTSIGNAAFLLALFLRPNFYLREGIRANGSRKAKRIHEDTFLSMSISAPQRKEQDQIAVVLDKTELLIAATQSRLSSLELLKKALLQDLFI
ncbi:restriction endonuclease subunit S [Lacticaseibacillus paracasei]|uniref:restriction endonuclease subunit S n=1 Tax=Lacticaseibacillus paracasei TaxID=1597 RepID=UPI00287B6428|nr:restriction endonuclease subunit S [Lacticaseibacillus paracasei]